MFGLFKKKATQPLSVEEIEDSLYEGFLKFMSFDFDEYNKLIKSHKQNHPKMCPKSNAGNGKILSIIHEDEIYPLIWMFIFNHMRKDGLRVNTELFQPGFPLWKVIDEYIQKAKAHFKLQFQYEEPFFWFFLQAPP